MKSLEDRLIETSRDGETRLFNAFHTLVSCPRDSQHNPVPSSNRSVTVAARKTKALPSREREKA
jgi:hypothetical protein